MDRRFVLLPSLAAVLSFLLAGATPARAQDADTNAPAHVAIVEGGATLERDGRPESSPLNMPLLSGDRLRTSDGRVEVLFGDGSTLDIDAGTTIDFQSDDLLRLIEGRVRISIPGPSRTVSYRVDSPAGSARITEPGDYRVSLLHDDRETQLELAVIRGAAEISTEQGTTPLRAGERAYASAGLAPSYAYAYNSANMDAFDRWSETRRDARLGASAAYLPSNVRSYAPVLDEYGDWNYMQPYGYVWYPRVAVGWRPYYYGRWISYPRYGWTWVGLDVFGWPTHHYGRWGFSAGRWFWIPGSRWSPAWVSWAYAPGYVSWCPLGFDNRAVFQINVAIGNRYHYSPWNAWTVVGAPYFGRGFVQQRVVYVDRLDVRRRPVFVSRPAAPAVRDVAVARSAVPIRAAGVRSVPGVDARGSYFSRGGDGGEHVVAPGSRAALPPPSRGRASAVTTVPLRGGRIVESSPPASSAPGAQPSESRGVAPPRAVPRTSGAESPRAPERPAPAGSRAAPRGSAEGAPAPRAVSPRGQYAPRQDIRPMNRAPENAAPIQRAIPREPRSIERAPQYGPAPRVERPIDRAPQVYAPAPREYARPGTAAPREYARPGTAMPRETPAPREYARPAPPQRMEAPRPAPAPHAAPTERATPAPSRGQGRTAPAPRGRG
jgi:FecR protein